MGRVRPAVAIASAIRKRDESRNRKQFLRNYLQKLHTKYSKEEITYARYIEILHKKSNGRNIHEWIDYYEKCIADHNATPLEGEPE